MTDKNYRQPLNNTQALDLGQPNKERGGIKYAS